MATVSACDALAYLGNLRLYWYGLTGNVELASTLTSSSHRVLSIQHFVC